MTSTATLYFRFNTQLLNYTFWPKTAKEYKADLRKVDPTARLLRIERKRELIRGVKFANEKLAVLTASVDTSDHTETWCKLRITELYMLRHHLWGKPHLIFFEPSGLEALALESGFSG